MSQIDPVQNRSKRIVLMGTPASRPVAFPPRRVVLVKYAAKNFLLSFTGGKSSLKLKKKIGE
jgi:hypothetical protein